MKLFSGFSIRGAEVRWYEANIARGRPYGFWGETGRYVNAEFNGPTLWFGSTAGLTMAFVKATDARGEAIYDNDGGYSFSGEQRGQREYGVGQWIDEWVPEGESILQVFDPTYGTTSMNVEAFSSSWQSYLRSYAGGYVVRSRWADPPHLPINEKPPYSAPDLVATISGSFW